MKYRVWFLLFSFLFISNYRVFSKERKDVIKTTEGKLIIEHLGHASVKFQYRGIVLYCDPVFNQQTTQPKADIVCLSHNHYDHFNLKSISEISTPNTRFICNEELAGKLNNSIILKNGEKTTLSGISIEAIPAYNLQSRPNQNLPYHPKGVGNGYLINFDELTVYIAGDTDLIPEMKDLPKIDIVFLPVMAPYTMGVEQFIEAAKKIRPSKVYPYHTGVTDLKRISEMFGPEKDIELVIP